MSRPRSNRQTEVIARGDTWRVGVSVTAILCPSDGVGLAVRLPLGDRGRRAVGTGRGPAPAAACRQRPKGAP